MLSIQLNEAILKHAPRFTAKDFAPHDQASLTAQAASGLIVWAGSSEHTIYGLPSVNHAFRAWHDQLHLKLQAPFTLEGETLVALEQARLMRNDALGDIIMAEVIGQALFYKETGDFPIDQVGFINNYMKGMK